MILSRSLVQRTIFCITCCISTVLAGTLCHVRSVSFLLLEGLLQYRPFPNATVVAKPHNPSPLEFLFCHLRIGFLFSLCSLSICGGVVTREAMPRTKPRSGQERLLCARPHTGTRTIQMLNSTISRC